MAEEVQNLILDGEGNLQFQEHPLLNPLVMQNVFSFMESTASVKDLKNFRLVCQVWNESSQKVWRKVAPLRLGPPERSIKTRSQDLEVLPPDNYVPVNKFLEMMQDPLDPLQFQQKPFTNLVLFGIDFTGSVPTILKHLKSRRFLGTNLWNYLKYGQNHVKSFGFNGCHFPKEAVTGTCLGKLGIATKVSFVNAEWDFMTDPRTEESLESLSNQWLKEVEIYGDDPAGFYIFLFACPNLEVVTLRCNYPGRDDDKLIDLVCLGQVHHRYFQIKKLDVLESRFFKSFQRVSRLIRHWNQNPIRFPLELLTLTLETYDPYSEDDFDSASLTDLHQIFQPLVELFESTLKILKVFRAPIHNVIPNNEPLFLGDMSVLEELHLYGNLVAAFSFLEQTPNLKVLRIDTRCPSLGNHMEKLYYADRSPAKVAWFRERYHPFQEDLLVGTEPEIRLRLHLEHMTDLHLECNLSPETIQFLGKWMPNLKVFKGIMTDDVWKAVCQWMPALEEVGILRGSQVGEEALTGCYNSDSGALREPLSIVRLSNLRRFVYMSYCGQSSIGDLTVRRGFLEMPWLGMVHVCVSQQLSLEAEAALKEGILNCTIVRNTNENCLGGWDCCEEFNFLREFNN